MINIFCIIFTYVLRLCWSMRWTSVLHPPSIQGISKHLWRPIWLRESQENFHVALRLARIQNPSVNGWQIDYYIEKSRWNSIVKNVTFVHLMIGKGFPLGSHSIVKDCPSNNTTFSESILTLPADWGRWRWTMISTLMGTTLSVILFAEHTYIPASSGRIASIRNSPFLASKLTGMNPFSLNNANNYIKPSKLYHRTYRIYILPFPFDKIGWNFLIGIAHQCERWPFHQNGIRTVDW